MKTFSEKLEIATEAALGGIFKITQYIALVGGVLFWAAVMTLIWALFISLVQFWVECHL